MVTAVVVALLLQAQTPPAPPPPPPTALIFGRVVDAANGRPVPGATVAITGPAAAGAPRLLTDAQGRFVYRNLRAGSYGLTATLAGYSEGAFGRRRPEGPAQQVELSDGERNTDITIVIWKHAAITGAISDEAGEPMVGAAVRAFRRVRMGGRVMLRPAGNPPATDDRGFYRIGQLTPGEYLICIPSGSSSMPASLADAYRAGGPVNDPARRELMDTLLSISSSPPAIGPYSTRIDDQVIALQRGLVVPSGDGAPTAVYATTYYPGTQSAGEATLVTVGPGEERGGVDIQLRPVPTVKVSGTVMLPDRPASHFAVRLEPPDVPAGFFGVTNLAPATATDTSGAFTFPNVPAGNYTLRVTKTPAASESDLTTTTIVQGAGMATTMSVSFGNAVLPRLPADPTWWAVMPLPVGRRDITNVQVPLQAGARFSGRIEFDGAAERPDEEQLRRIGVTANPVDILFISGNRPAPIDRDGSFRTMGVPAGRYSLGVRPAPKGWWLRSAVHEGRDIADAPIEVTGDINGVVVTFTDRMAELSGTVQGPAGPDADASVVVFPVDSAMWAVPNSRRVRITRTTEKGTFSLRALPPGAYYAIALPDELAADWTDPRSLEAFARDATQVELEEGTKTQTLRTVKPRRLP